jgi:uncharacterized protein
MKVLLIIAIVALLVWRWRMGQSQRRTSGAAAPKAAAVTMQCCDRCGMHIPANEAIAGAAGVYCSQEHRIQAEP